ncbi:hypothetical protein [Oscillibacter sp.]|uniref:hypothetical protein n=1 Tax=Oscillibacter sp. TaxID=1945593 RepID=UPI00289B19F8|nr:hypothetical protein [Oscillibacter sp.]
MDVRKDAGAAERWAAGEDDMGLINRFSKGTLTAEQVYTFAVRLCDNEVDRDFERFDEAALNALGDLFVGKSGVFDHQWSALGQTARIYRTELVREAGCSTAAGDGYCYLKAWAYLMKTEKNADLIAEIEGGIKKEVSVGCAVGRSVCSVCGEESGSCQHQKGQSYGGKLCYVELREPKDAYEWSFVAVPAQREAGVMKRFGGQSGAELGQYVGQRKEFQEAWDTLRKQAELGRNYLSGLRREVVRLALVSDEALNGTVFQSIADKLEEAELLELKKAYEARAEKVFSVQLRRVDRGAERGDGELFRV